MKTNRRNNRRGAVLVLTAFMMIAMLALLAFAVDLGYLQVVSTQLQRSADAAAMAAAGELLHEQAVAGQPAPSASYPGVRTVANRFAEYNTVAHEAPSLASGDTSIGQLSYPFSPTQIFDVSSPGRYNAVSVNVQRTAQQNGEVGLFFARALGMASQSREASATAVFLNNFGGFKTPRSGDNLGILPFALDVETWNDLLAGGGDDNWKDNETTGQITAGSDGVREVNLYPQGTGSPGNRGTVDIGSSNNSTADISRQIVNGITQQDLDHIGGKLELDSTGKCYLNGDTGISAGVKDELASIKGQPRIIPIFSEVNKPGNNAMYTIVAFAGIRIVDVDLTGSKKDKRLIIQPARVTAKGAIPADNTAVRSYNIFSPVWLIR